MSRRTHRLPPIRRFAAAATALAGLAGAAVAQAPAEIAAPLPPVEAASAAAGQGPEARVERLVTEDDSVRIEEDRVRGQVRRIVVHSKLRGMGSYEIAAPDPGRAPADDPRAGKRIWLNLPF